MTQFSPPSLQRQIPGPRLPRQGHRPNVMMRLASSRTLAAVLDQFSVSGTRFVTSFCVGRLLGKESLGNFFILISIFTVLQCLADQLIHAPYLVRAPGLESDRLRRYRASVLVHSWWMTIAGVIAVLLASAEITWQYGTFTLTAQMLLLLAVFLPGMLLKEFIHGLLHNQLRQWEAFLMGGVVSALQIALLVALAWAEALTLPLTILIVGGVPTIVAILWLPRISAMASPGHQEVKQEFFENWRIGKWMLGSYLVGSSSPTVLPWFLAILHGSEVTGLLAACLTLAGIAQTVLRGISKFILPYMSTSYAQDGQQGLIRALKQFLSTSTIAMTLLGGGLLIGGGQLVQWVYGDEYQGTTAVMQTLAIGCWLQAIDVATGNALLVLSLLHRSFIADCFRFVVTVVLAALLIPSYAALGVALAMVIGMTAGLILRSYYLVVAIRKTPTAEETVASSLPMVEASQ